MDNAVIARNLIDMMRIVPQEFQKPMVDQVFDLFGLERPRIKPLTAQEQLGGEQGAPTASPLQGMPTPQSLTTAANTMQGQ